jgi:hypothetical protein
MLLKSLLAVGPMMVLLMRVGELQQVMLSDEGPETYEEISPVFLPLIVEHDRENARRISKAAAYAHAIGMKVWPKDLKARVTKLCEHQPRNPWDDTEMTVHLQGLTKPEIARACFYLEIKNGTIRYIGNEKEKEKETVAPALIDNSRVTEARPL